VIPQLPAPPAVKLRERVEVMRQPVILVMLLGMMGELIPRKR